MLLCVPLAFSVLTMSSVRADKPQPKWIDLPLKSEVWESCNFGGDGELEFSDGQVVMTEGDPMTGIKLVNKFPTDNYEVRFEAKRIDGLDFFVGFTFPVDKSHCSLILGGWSGSVVGISNIDGYDASDNPTTLIRDFDNDKWFRVRVAVQPDRIVAWVDDEKIVDQKRAGVELDIRGEMDASLPFGISAFLCKVAYRKIQYRMLDKATKPSAPKSKEKSR